MSQGFTSPDGDQVFSTPQVTPGVEPGQMIPRRSSRPASLHIDHLQNKEWDPDIAVDTTTPVAMINSPRVLPDVDNSTSANYHKSRTLTSSVDSPCFVHSHLDKNASLTDWLKTRSAAGQLIIGDLGVAKSLQHSASAQLHIPNGALTFSRPGPDRVSSRESDAEEDEFVGNLTKQLAETAVGVREMSKQLGMMQVPINSVSPLIPTDISGRARVQSNIQNVLIVTKARDNRLIKLTRELALYLMLKRRPSTKRRLVV